ncbi:MAG: mechanosensitive ion channel family protein [Clostridia bacterium]|nr:MAG: mechanosensitive ion channel family protein [Clostridia bacterium]
MVIRHLVSRLFAATKMDENKEKTLAALLNSASRYIIYALAAMLILDLFGVPITALLAGAGVVGLAIGFGAQSLVKDIITGFFILFEDQFHVGDFVEINGTVTGTVEELGLRTTSIREWSGRKVYLANSEINRVRNFNRQQLRAIVTATFPFDEDPVRVRATLEEVCRDMVEQHRDYFLADASGALIEPPQIYGVTDIDKNDKGAQVTIIALTKPQSLWTVEKVLREMVWQKCNAHGIRLAYPRRVYETQGGSTLSLAADALGQESGDWGERAGQFPGQPG